MALILNFNAAHRAKQLRQPIQAIAFPTDNHSHCFYPEMGEVRNPTKLLLGGYVYNCYSIRWAEADNETKLYYSSLKLKHSDHSNRLDRKNFETRHCQSPLHS